MLMGHAADTGTEKMKVVADASARADATSPAS
jgi:hypothetical protein